MAAVPPHAAAQLIYDVIPLGPWPDGRPYLATKLNDRGQVIALHASSAPEWGIYLWTSGQWTELDPPNNGRTRYPEDMNNLGQIVGQIVRTDEPIETQLWDNGVWSEFQPFVPGASQVAVNAINDVGDYVGRSVVNGVEDKASWAFINGQAIRLEQRFPGERLTLDDSRAINNRGVAIGQSVLSTTLGSISRAVRWVNGEVNDLGTLDPTIELQRNGAAAINDQGMIVGTSNGRPFVWKEGVMSPLLLANEQISGVHAIDINNQGFIVGAVATLGSPVRNVLWDLEGQAVLLDELLEEHFPDSQERRVHEINNNGWIRGAARDASGEIHGFLLVPIPEPSTWRLLAIGLITASVLSRQVRPKLGSRERVRKTRLAPAP